jgi:hypothetical protein
MDQQNVSSGAEWFLFAYLAILTIAFLLHQVDPPDS